MGKLNKEQQSELNTLRRALAVSIAWRRTEPVERDVPPPPPFAGHLSKGWDSRAWNGQWRVEKACSSSINHGYGWDRTDSQGSRHLYSTRERALRAARYELEQQFARTLADIDEQIGAEVEASREERLSA